MLPIFYKMGKFHLFGFAAPVFLLACAFSCAGTPEQRQKNTVSGEKAALKAYYEGKFETAISAFEALNAKNGENTRVKQQLALLYRESGDKKWLSLLEERAKKYADTIDPAYTSEYTELFAAYYLSGDIKKAAEYRDLIFNPLITAGNFKDIREKAGFLFLNAMLKKDEGKTDDAVKLFRESLELERFRPAAWFSLGGLLEKTDAKEAESCYRTAISQDAAFARAFFPLGKLLAQKKAWGQAGNMFARAARVYPSDPEIAAALHSLRRTAMPAGETRVRLGEIRKKPPEVTPAGKSPGEGLIRIGLGEERELVTVKTGGAFKIKAEGGGGYSKPAGEQFWVKWNPPGPAPQNPSPNQKNQAVQNPSLSVQDKNGKNLLSSDQKLVMELGSVQNTSIVAGVLADSPGTSRSYRGALEFIPGPKGMTVVNIIRIEEYLYSVVPSEMPASWPFEALKAQAIACRSYSIAQLGQFADHGFDLYGTPHSMAYHGVDGEKKISTKAVDDTRGIILKGGGQPLKAYFSANHGGYSEDSLAMWGFDSFMAAVPDKLAPARKDFLPLDELDSWLGGLPYTYSSVQRYHFPASYRWEKWVSPEEIRRRLILRGDDDPGEINRIISRGRGISGRVYEIEVQGKKGNVRVHGDPIWFSMGALRSSLFTIAYKFDKNGKIEYVIFRGAGHGHGIGLDQHGAAGMANSGFKAEDILGHYYPRAELSKL